MATWRPGDLAGFGPAQFRLCFPRCHCFQREGGRRVVGDPSDVAIMEVVVVFPGPGVPVRMRMPCLWSIIANRLLQFGNVSHHSLSSDSLHIIRSSTPVPCSGWFPSSGATRPTAACTDFDPKEDRQKTASLGRKAVWQRRCVIAVIWQCKSQSLKLPSIWGALSPHPVIVRRCGVSKPFQDVV